MCSGVNKHLKRFANVVAAININELKDPRCREQTCLAGFSVITAGTFPGNRRPGECTWCGSNPVKACMSRKHSAPADDLLKGNYIYLLNKDRKYVDEQNK